MRLPALYLNKNRGDYTLLDHATGQRHSESYKYGRNFFDQIPLFLRSHGGRSFLSCKFILTSKNRTTRDAAPPSERAILLLTTPESESRRALTGVA